MRSINEYKKLKSSSVKFARHKNLRQIEHTVKETDLPIESIIGCVYLIKGNNIIEFYSYWEVTSLYIQINYSKPVWFCKITIVNYEHGDPENLNFLFNGCDVLTSIDNSHDSILGLVGMGFDVWKK